MGDSPEITITGHPQRELRCEPFVIVGGEGETYKDALFSHYKFTVFSNPPLELC